MSTSAKFSSKKKAAVVMVAIGSDYAARIYKHLRDEDIEQLTLEVAGLEKLGSDSMEMTLNEFYEMCLAQKFITEGGVDYAKDVLEKAFGPQSARELIQKVTRSLGSRSFDFMKNVEPKHLFTFIQNEHPQTIALILSYAKKNQAATVLSMLPRQKQIDVSRRIALMDRTSPDVVKDVERALEKKLSTIGAQEVADIGGVKYIAELLNSVDRSTEKYIIDELNKNDPALADEVRKLMFVFEDITKLDDAAIQRTLRDIDSKDLVAALKGSAEEVQQVIFSNMSNRVAEQVREDMEYSRGIRHRDVEAAQQRIVAKIRELEDAGEIIVSHGRDDMIV